MVSAFLASYSPTKKLWNEWVLVKTNRGTFGADECSAKLGTKTLAEGVYAIYERVGDGERKREGCPVAAAPGIAISMGRDILAQKRRRLARIMEQIEVASVCN